MEESRPLDLGQDLALLNLTANVTSSGTSSRTPDDVANVSVSYRLDREVAFFVLTVEVLHRIGSRLCLHCCGNEVLGDWRRALVERRGLRSLSSTCRALRRVAQVYLFHRIEGVHGWPSLARTLTRRWDLALCVRQLYIPRAGWTERLATNAPRQARVNGDVPHEVDLVPDQGSLELLLALVPNLELCSVPLCEMDADRRERAFGGDVFASLRTLRLAGGKDFSSALRRRRLLEMVEACPALEWLALEGSLRYHGFRELQVEQLGAALQRLRTLQLEQILLVEYDARDLQRFMWLCPRLQRFQYVAPPLTRARISPPMEIPLLLESLAAVKATLRILDVDLGYIRHRRCRDEFANASLLENLSGFTELRVLYLDENSICAPPPDISDDESDEDDDEADDMACIATCIVEMLPAAIRRLGIRALDGNMRIYADVHGLGAQLREGMFPELTRFDLVIKSADRERRRENLMAEMNSLEDLLRTALARTSVRWTLQVQEVYGPVSFRYTEGRLQTFARGDDIPAGSIGEDEWRTF